MEGRVPNDQYMKATHGRKLLNGDIANLSIGQGDAETTPLQMAQAMAIIGNGGTFYQTRLVQQVQTVDNEIVTAFQVREKKTLGASADTMAQLRDRTDQRGERSGRHGSSSQSGKRGGGGENRDGAVGTEEQGAHGGVVCGLRAGGESAVCVCRLYEGDVGADVHGGSHAAPMIGMILKDIYKEKDNGNKRRRTPEPGETPIRRAEPVEEEEGD